MCTSIDSQYPCRYHVMYSSVAVLWLAILYTVSQCSAANSGLTYKLLSFTMLLTLDHGSHDCWFSRVNDHKRTAIHPRTFTFSYLSNSLSVIGDYNSLLQDIFAALCPLSVAPQHWFHYYCHLVFPWLPCNTLSM